MLDECQTFFHLWVRRSGAALRVRSKIDSFWVEVCYASDYTVADSSREWSAGAFLD